MHPSLTLWMCMHAPQLSTTEPWSNNIPNPTEEAPHTAHVLVKHSSSSYTPPPSSLSPITDVSRLAPFLSLPDIIAASLDTRLHFWVWDASADAAYHATDPSSKEAAGGGSAAGSSSSSLSHTLGNPAGCASSVSGGGRHFVSHPQHGHSASIDVLLEVPTSGAIG